MALQTVSVSPAAYKLLLTAPIHCKKSIMEGLAPSMAAHFAAIISRPANIKKIDVDSAEKVVSLVDEATLLDAIEACDKRVGVVNAILSRKRRLGLLPAPENRIYRSNRFSDTESTKKILSKAVPSHVKLTLTSKIRFPDDKLLSDWIMSLDTSDLNLILSWFASSKLRHVESIAAAVTGLCLKSDPEVLARELHAGVASSELCHHAAKSLSKESSVQHYLVLTRTRRNHNTMPLESVKPLVRSGAVGFSRGFLEQVDSSGDLGLRFLCDRVKPEEALEVVKHMESAYRGDLRYDVLRLMNNASLIDAVLSVAKSRDWFSSDVAPHSGYQSLYSMPPRRIGCLLHVPGISDVSVATLLEVSEAASIVKFLLSKENQPSKWMFDAAAKRVSASTIFWGSSELLAEDISNVSLLEFTTSLVEHSCDLTQVLCGGSGVRDKSHLFFQSVTAVLVDRLGETPDKWGVFSGLLESLKDCTVGAVLDATDAILG